MLLYLLSFQDDIEIVVLFAPICNLFIMIVILYTVCELAERMSSEFDDINILIGRFDWYLLPLETQQMLPLIMANAQQKIGFKCFGSTMCNRNSFKKVS